MYSEVVAVYRTIYVKHINEMCRYNAKFTVLNLAVNILTTRLKPVVAASEKNKLQLWC
jgi:hypothetical protein